MRDRRVIRWAAVLLAAGILAMGVGPVHRVKAAQAGRLLGNPVHIKAGETILLSLVNLDSKPVAVEFEALDARDLSVIAVSHSFTIPAGHGNFHTIQMTVDAFVVPGWLVASAGGDASLKVSVQVRDGSGQTQFFDHIGNFN